MILIFVFDWADFAATRLKGVIFILSDSHSGWVKSLINLFQRMHGQRCQANLADGLIWRAEVMSD